MLPVELPPIDNQLEPETRDLEGTRYWLSQLQLTDLPRAQRAIRDQVERLNRFALPPKTRLAVLEELLDTVDYVQTEFARRLIGKALPLAERDAGILRAISELWREMAVASARCLQEAMDARQGEKELALACYRAMGYTAREMLDYVRTSYEFDPELWRRLHGFYGLAEELEITQVPVHLGDGARSHSCGDLYVRILLVFHANPYELSRRQYALLERWLGDWIPLAPLGRVAPRAGEGTPPMEVNLSSAAGLRYPDTGGFSTALRYLDMSGICKEIRVKSVLLSQGQSPRRLGLGNGEEKDCGELLGVLQRQWCEGNVERMFERRPSRDTSEVCFGIEAIHSQVSGRPFRQPRKGGELTEQEQKEIAALGRRASDTTRAKREKKGSTVLETWGIEDRSTLGLRLLVREQGGERLSVGSLIATRPSDRKRFSVGVIRWIMVNRDGQLRVGIRSFAGDPEPTAVRRTGVNVPSGEKYIPALVLPAVPAVQIPPTLVLPAGWYRPKRVVEVFGREHERALMNYVVEKGRDYERISFTTLPS